MKTSLTSPHRRLSLRLLTSVLGLLISALCLPAFGQGTAFTYQGRLNDGGSPANGIYDLRFTIYDAVINGTALAGPLTNTPASVSNGLFTVTLDFGAGVFTGADRWLEIGARTNGGGAFTTLAPRQPITSTPYAIRAANAGTATSVPAGTITSSMLAPGSAASNLLASGVSAVASSGVVLSEQEYSSNLFNQGYVRLGKVDLVPESWRTLTNGPPLGDFQGLARRDFAAVWSGTEMFVWGGQNSSGVLNSGGRYNPATDSWVHLTTSNAPTPQTVISAAWSGTYLVVWGNNGPTRGGRYNPTTDTWLPIDEANAPSARIDHTAVWTGTHLIVWGGSATGYLNSGARYDPATNGWSAVQTTGAPSIRGRHTALWTGTEMIVWGGYESHSCGMFCVTVTNYNDGARYNPAANNWTPMTAVSPPLKRYSHSAVWTGTEMIVWGGLYGEGTFAFGTNINSGARYNPTLNQWTAATSTVGAPAYRDSHRAHWTGNRMIIWGGVASSTSTNFTDGALYDPVGNSWTAMSSTGAPAARGGYNTVWSGSQMLYFGGASVLDGSFSEIGRRYTATNDTWSLMAAGGDPSARADHKAVWAGTEMIVWGGTAAEYALRSGGRLNPSQTPANMWSSISTSGGPSARTEHTAVWTGTEMIVWGGFNNGQAFNSGGRYTPALNSWTAVATNGAPTPRGRHAAVWTGDRMVVWGGYDGTNFLATGGRYNPAANTWQNVSAASAPAIRADATAVWSGTEMLVWGGQSVSAGVTNFLNTGGRYDPGADSWQSLPTIGAPAGRFGHTAVYGANEMIVWGGETQIGKTNSGARYQSLANQWIALPTNSAPSSRAKHAAVWAGTQMIVWGGFDGTNELANGARYEPLRDLWTATTTTNAPGARQRHTAVWSGTEMIVWGGRMYNGVGDVYLDTASAYTPARTMYLYLRP